MPPTILTENDFEGEVGVVNLKVHDADWEYVGSDNRYIVDAAGFSTASVSATVSVARKTYNVAAGLRARLVADVTRGGVDQVGGGVELYAYIPDVAIGTWDRKDCLRCTIGRVDANSISLTMTWVKAASEPAPATEQIAFAGSVAHAGGASHRYEFEFDESLDTVTIYRSDYGTGANPVLLSEGALSPELVAHLTADRHPGFEITNAASGITYFQIDYFAVFDMGVAEVLTGPPCKCQLDVFDDDGTTILWTVSTDPAHAFPYLVEPENYCEQQIDVATGAASLGTVMFTVIDIATLAGDQTSGFMMGKLATAGLADLAGHRGRMIRFVPDGLLGYQVLMDGPIGTPRLNADFASISAEIRDPRETERKLRCFDLVGPAASTISGATPTTPTDPGTGYPFDWDVVVSP